MVRRANIHSVRAATCSYVQWVLLSMRFCLALQPNSSSSVRLVLECVINIVVLCISSCLPFRSAFLKNEFLRLFDLVQSEHGKLLEQKNLPELIHLSCDLFIRITFTRADAMYAIFSKSIVQQIYILLRYLVNCKCNQCWIVIENALATTEIPTVCLQ